MSYAPQFTATPTLDHVQVSTAATTLDGVGATLLASGPAIGGEGKGKRINRVTIRAAATTAAGLVRFFISTDGGVTRRLLAEVTVAVVTPSNTVAAFNSVVPDLVGLVLADANAQVYVSTTVAQAINVVLEGGLL